MSDIVAGDIMIVTVGIVTEVVVVVTKNNS
jgi:hypothetical protein